MRAIRRPVGDQVSPPGEVIEIHLVESTQLFNAMDPAPTGEKDLDPRVEEFIVDWARELPAKASLAPRVEERQEARQNAAGLGALLDSAFGFFVWAIHFLVIYVVEAVACQLGLGLAAPGTQTTFIAVLALVTIAAGAVVVVHGFRRHRQQRKVPEQHFRMSVTVGADAIATLGILWQLFALLLVPVCE